MQSAYNDNDVFLQARGEVIASISTISSVEDFIVPSRELERRLLELSLAQVLEDIERSGETGVKETVSAQQVIKLVDDFIFTSGKVQPVNMLRNNLVEVKTGSDQYFRGNCTDIFR